MALDFVPVTRLLYLPPRVLMEGIGLTQVAVSLNVNVLKGQVGAVILAVDVAGSVEVVTYRGVPSDALAQRARYRVTEEAHGIAER